MLLFDWIGTPAIQRSHGLYVDVHYIDHIIFLCWPIDCLCWASAYMWATGIVNRPPDCIKSIVWLCYYFCFCFVVDLKINCVHKVLPFIFLVQSYLTATRPFLSLFPFIQLSLRLHLLLVDPRLIEDNTSSMWVK